MTPEVFDRALRRRRLDRAARAALPGADALLARTLEEAEDRLALVMRRFERAIDLATPGLGASAALQRTGKVDGILWLTPSLTGAARARQAGHADPLIAIADEESLPLAPESADLVVSLLALHAVNDLPGALVQIRRALKPDGLFLAALFGGGTLAELRQAFAAAEAELTGGAAPRVAPFLDVRDLGGLLQRAGFALPVTDVDAVTVRYPDPFALLTDLKAMGETSTLAARSRVPLRRDVLARMAQWYADTYGAADGRVPARFEILWASGWAPHASQPKPLRPGSAAARLADALGTTERSTGEKPGGEGQDV